MPNPEHSKKNGVSPGSEFVEKTLADVGFSADRWVKSYLDELFKDAPEAVRERLEEAVFRNKQAVSCLTDELAPLLESFVADLTKKVEDPRRVGLDAFTELAQEHLKNATLNELLGRHLSTEHIISLATNAAMSPQVAPGKNSYGCFLGVQDPQSFDEAISCDGVREVVTWFRVSTSLKEQERQEVTEALERNYRQSIRPHQGVVILEPKEVLSDIGENSELEQSLSGFHVAIAPVGREGEMFGHFVVLFDLEEATEEVFVQSKFSLEHIRNATESALRRALRVMENERRR